MRDPFAESMKTGFMYKDVFEFQEKHPTKEEREKVLQTMSYEEIMHIAYTCGTIQGANYYAQHAMQAKERDRQKENKEEK